MSKQVNVDFVTRQIEVDTDGKEYYVSAAVAAKDAEQSMLSAQNAANAAEKIATDLGLVDDAVQTAVASATTASNKADIATAKADVATTKASEASTSATTAAQKADASSISATNAAQSYANADAIATQLTEYLATKETLTAPAVDKTLLIEGAAADSKVVGELKSDMYDLYKGRTIVLSSSGNWYDQFGIESGKKYRIRNAGETVFNCYTSNVFVHDASTDIQSVGTLNPDDVVVFTASADADNFVGYAAGATVIDITEIGTVVQTIQENVKDNSDKLLEKIDYQQLSTLVGGQAQNLFSNIGKTDGKYVDLETGRLVNLSGYSVTDFFHVFHDADYDLPFHSSGSQIAFYDKDFNYVTGFTTLSNSFKVPNNSDILFARWCGETSHYDEWALYLSALQFVKYIDTTEGLLAGVIDAISNGIKKIVVEAGTYDIIAEYKAKYGNDYFTNYASDYNGLANGYYDRGIWLDNINIKFKSGSKVTAIYDGANSNVTEYFSAFAMGQNVTIDGLVLDAKNLRYGIHPDFHPDSTAGNLVMKNCDLHHFKEISQGVNDNQAIGAGLDIHSDWLFENCIFRSDTNHAVFRIHNNVSSDAESKIVIKDCYIVGDGYIRLNSYSTSAHQTTAIVTGCSWKNPAVVGKETEDSSDNITMYAWNNELRS